MSIVELKKELVGLIKNFVGGPIGKLKKHELEHRLCLLKKTVEAKCNTPEPEAASAGPPAARDVKTETVSLDGETNINMPIAPVGGKVHSARYTKKAKDSDADSKEKPAAKADKPAKKARITAPKVVLPEAEPEAKKVVKKRVPKPKAAAEPAAPAAAPAPEKLPGNVRKVADTITLC